MQKSAVHDAIIAQLQRELDLQTRAAHESRDEATSAENKSEGKYDMRSQEAAYLAEGQARIVLEIAESLALYHGLDLTELPANAPAAVGAVVKLEASGRPTCYFIGPRNGGLEVHVADNAITVITPSSPLGRQIVGQRVGATVQLPVRGGPVRHTIIEIR